MENSTTTRLTAKATLKSNRHARLRMTLSLMLTDLLSLVASLSLAFLARAIFLGPISEGEFVRLWPVLILFAVAFALRGLYPAVGMNPVDELRVISATTTVIFLLLLAATFWFRTTIIYSRIVLTATWLISLFLIPVDRWLIRVLSRNTWGEPILVVGNGPTTERIQNYLLSHNHLSMFPAVILTGETPPSPQAVQSFHRNGIQTALLVSREISDETMNSFTADGEFAFKRVILISSLGWIGSLGVVTHDLEGILGMEVQQNLLNPWDRSLKRTLDLVMAPLILLVCSPVLALIALAVKLEDHGPVFYRQTRIGRIRREFAMLKFRTMVPEAEKKLQECLDADPELLDEWNSTQKLKNDPRLTRVGKFLRKWSLDELPQLMNVIRGEMSLVGPRPFFPGQTHFYGKIMNLYCRVRPGMTGMWQVSGRNDRGYDERIRYDEYYIRNWSTWLDIYILLRTVWVVLRRDGAY